MVWAKIDDEILDNQKIARAGPLGFALHVAAITWCCRNLTDGFIPYSRVNCLLDFSGPSMSVHDTKSEDAVFPPADPLEIAQWLVECSLWHEESGGFRLNDFLTYNPSKAKVLAERDRARKGKAKLEPVSPKPRQSLARSSAEPTPNLARSSDGPVPVPVPVPIQPDPSTAPQLALTVPANDAGEGQSGSKRGRGSRLPADWKPSQVTQAWAKAEGVADPCGRILDEFRDFWIGVPGARGVKLDWDATYRNRVRQVATAGGSRRAPIVQSADNRAWKMPEEMP